MVNYHKILSAFSTVLIIPTLIFFGQLPLSEGYNPFDPYIDTEFAPDFTPKKFETISLNQNRDQVIKIIGKPLYIDSSEFITYTYSNDAYFSRRNKDIPFLINDFAWFATSIDFNYKGQIVDINYGWCYD